MRVRVKKVNEKNIAEWVRLRGFLWENGEYEVETQTYMEDDSSKNAENNPVWIAYVGKKAVGFIEISIRENEDWHPHPMTFLEGVYVIPELHKRGIAKKLLYIASRWTLKNKFFFMGSQIKVNDDLSAKMLLALGFRFIETNDGEAKFVKGIE